MPDFRISVQHIFIVSTRTILHSTNSYMMLAKVLIIVKQIKDWLNGLQIKIPDSEAVRLGAEFPKPGWRHPQERDPNPQANGIPGCRNVLHLVVRSFRRFTCKCRFFASHYVHMNNLATLSLNLLQEYKFKGVHSF